MSRKLGFLIALGVLVFILPKTAFSEPKPAISVYDSELQDGNVRARVSVRSAEEGPVDFDVKDPAANRALSFSVRPLPIHLMVLVDASQLCHTNQIDAYVAGLLGRLKKTLPRASSASLATFTSTTLEVVSTDRSIGDLENLPIRCEPKLVSASYEKALQRLLDTVPNDDLKTAVWVFTSGNIQVSPALISTLAKRGIAVNVILYNAIMERDLSRLLETQNASAGKKIFGLSVLNRDEKFLPERWFGLDVTVPGYLKGNSLTIQVSAKQKEVAVGSETLSLSVDLSKRSFWARHGSTIMIVFSVLLLAGLVVALVKFYRAKLCGQCGRALRHGNSLCVFCHHDELGRVVGSFNEHDRHKKGRLDVIYLNRDRAEVGFKRRHQVRLGGRSSSKSCVAVIQSEIRNGKRAYLLIPQQANSVFVNRRLFEAPRYLGHGDVITVMGKEMTFLYGGNNEARA